jgi:predicted CopG family antitoxin
MHKIRLVSILEKRKRITISKEVYGKLEELAKIMGVSVSEYVETLVESQRFNMHMD